MNSQYRPHVDLTLVHEGGRRMDSAPNGVRVGVVRLSNWQTHGIEVPAGRFVGYDAHLIKVNYEIDIEPGPDQQDALVRSLFRIHGWGGEAPCIVVDALPHFGTFAETPTPYVLNQFLNFVPSEDGTSAQALLPAALDSRYLRCRRPWCAVAACSAR